MDSSVFVNNAREPLLNDYEILDEDEVMSSSWQQSERSSPLPKTWFPEIPESDSSSTYSLECALDDAYRYYWIRGFNRFLSIEIGQTVIWTWLVLFCVFLGTCIDYHGIMSVSSQTSIWTFVSISHFGRNWFFILSLILYGIYFVWRSIKLARDIKRMWKMRTFYQVVLGIEEFDLRTIRWAEIVSRISAAPIERLNQSLDMDVPQQLSRSMIASRIVAKENWFRKLLDSGLINVTFNLPMDTELCMLTRGLQWNLTYCVINFFFGQDLRLRKEYTNDQIGFIVQEQLAVQLSRRITVIAILNILMIPFLVVFVAIYAVFRYGEEFYKDPGNITTRQWSLAARWYFRDNNEMPHVLEERMRLSTKYAMKYMDQFSSGYIEGIAKAVAFIIGSFVMWMLILSILNQQTLLMLTVAPGKALLWWITILSGIWVLCRSVLKEQHIFYPKEALEIVKIIVRKLPEHFVPQAGSVVVFEQFRQLFPLRITQLLLEFAGVIVTPYILLTRIRPRAYDIVNFFCVEGNAEADQAATEEFDSSLLQSDVVIENVRRLEGDRPF